MPNAWGDNDAWGFRRIVVWIVGLLSAVLAVWSIIDLSQRSLYWYSRVYGFWVIAPPIWFFFEYNFIFKKVHSNLELLKYGQDVAQKFWAALLVLLAGIGYFKWNLTLH